MAGSSSVVNSSCLPRNGTFAHITSSPYYAQSNCLAENVVKQAKQLLEKCRKDGSDVQLGLLNLRNTPRDSMRSPAQRLISTRTRTTLPTSAKLLKPKPLSTSRVSYTHLKKVRRQQKQHHDKSARHQPLLKPYEVVYCLFKKKSCFFCIPTLSPIDPQTKSMEI